SLLVLFNRVACATRR
ncbi:hypothetical protein CMV_030608, partial [Castanea mollissima]